MSIKLKIYRVEPTTDGSGNLKADTEAFYVDEQGGEHSVQHADVIVPADNIATAISGLTDPEKQYTALVAFVIEWATTGVGPFDVNTLGAAIEAYKEKVANDAKASAIASAIQYVLEQTGVSTPEIVIP